MRYDYQLFSHSIPIHYVSNLKSKKQELQSHLSLPEPPSITTLSAIHSLIPHHFLVLNKRPSIHLITQKKAKIKKRNKKSLNPSSSDSFPSPAVQGPTTPQ